MKSLFLSIGAIGLSASIVGCGGMELGQHVQLNLDAATQKANVDFELSDGLEISMQGEFPIADGKGSITFVPATQTANAKIRISADLAALISEHLSFGITNKLPNGAPLPVAMTGSLFDIDVIKDKNFDVNALISLIPDLQLGATVGFAKLDPRYLPSGIAVCQNFRNDKKLAYAAVCVYGPTATVSGGIFVGGNFGQVLDLGSSEEEEVVALSASRAFSMTAAKKSVSSSPSIIMDSFSSSSSNWDDSIFDPQSKLKNPRVAMKAADNVRKVLRSRR